LSVSRHTAYNLVGAAVPIALALITVPIYLRLVGPDRYGVLAIAWLLLGYFGLFDLGLGRATSFRIAALRDASPQARADTFWAALTINLAMGLVGGAVLWLAGSLFFGHMFKVDEALRPEILASMPLLACAVPVATLTGVLTGAMQGRERFLETNTISVISTTLFQLLPLLWAWRFGPDLIGLLGAAILARAISLAVLMQRCHAVLARGQIRRLVKTEVPALLRYGGWVTTSSIFGPLLVIVDRFVIGGVLGAHAVTAYSVPFQLAQRIQVLPSALTTALFPKMSAAEGDERKAMAYDATHTLAALITPPVLVAIFLLEPLLSLWVGREMATLSTPLGRILILGFWANAFALVPFMKLQSSGRPDLVTKVLLIEIPPYLATLWAGMKLFGLPGSAMAFAARCIVDFVLLTWAAGRDFRPLPSLFSHLLMVVAAIALAGHYSPGAWQWWIGLALLPAFAASLGWRTLPQGQRNLIVSRTRAAFRAKA